MTQTAPTADTADTPTGTAHDPRVGATSGRVKCAKIFISFAPNDGPYLQSLELHLKLLERESLIAPWHSRMVSIGQDWRTAIDAKLNAADFVLLLVSADFIGSDYLFGEEMERAMARHRAGEATVVPVVVRPCDWETAPFGTLRALPNDHRPVSEWGNADAAWTDVAKSMRHLIAGSLVDDPRAGLQLIEVIKHDWLRVRDKRNRAHDFSWNLPGLSPELAEAARRHPRAWKAVHKLAETAYHDYHELLIYMIRWEIPRNDHDAYRGNVEELVSKVSARARRHAIELENLPDAISNSPPVSQLRRLQFCSDALMWSVAHPCKSAQFLAGHQLVECTRRWLLDALHMADAFLESHLENQARGL